MKLPARNNASARGSSLIEVMIAIGVLAVAIPLVFGTMVETGESNLSAQAETRSSWIVPTCFNELEYAMRGQSKFLKPLTPGESFPISGLVALAFDSEGNILSSVADRDYDSGMTKSGAESVRYIAVMSGTLDRDAVLGGSGGLNVKITLEYPASAPSAKRQKIDFHTRIP